MREIKFRAWDKERKEMRQVQLMDFSDWWVSTGHTWEREPALTYGERNSFKNEKTDRHIIMQYTGLRDSKRTMKYPEGQEIYEGDIIKYPTVGSGMLTSKVYWDNQFAQWCYGTGFHLRVGEPIKIEVVGNIYESEVN